jgi:hypothetical protein
VIPWSTDELNEIAKADELDISPLREDGVTYRTPTTIWCVAVGGALYVRAGNGPSSRWYRAAMRRKAGRVTAAGLTKAVTFEPAAGQIDERIDAAYREKYKDSQFLDDMLGAGVRAATLRVMPRETDTGSSQA